MECTQIPFGICLVPTSAPSGFFGFGEFISALALLVIVYTIADERYKFRISVAPLPLYGLTFAVILFIGLGVLITDVWAHEGWSFPQSFIGQATWRGILGLLFLTVAVVWLYYGFMRPPQFGKKNGLKFAQALFRVIVRGSPREMALVAQELAPSASNLIRWVRVPTPSLESKKKQDSGPPTTEGYANDILLLIGSRRFARVVVQSSPGTAITIFDAMTRANEYPPSACQFASNVSIEAIGNKESVFYEEEHGFRSGLLGYIKTFSQAVYGNFRLVENLGRHGHSPLDLDYFTTGKWDAQALQGYSRAILVTIGSYIEQGQWGSHSFALYRAVESFEFRTFDLYQIKDLDKDWFESGPCRKLRVVVKFITDAIELLNEREVELCGPKRARGDIATGSSMDLYDLLAKRMLDVVQSVGHITGPPDKAWTLHYNLVWSEFFRSYRKGRAWEIVRYKLRRLLYDEVTQLASMPNYGGARVLGVSLSVMGFRDDIGIDRPHAPLKRAVNTWVRKNYLSLRQAYPGIAEACLVGNVSFDAENRRLVKSYRPQVDGTISQEFLELDGVPS